MAGIEKEIIKSWDDLVSLLDDNFKHFNGYIFRGQADAEWKLESTLSRALRQTYPNARNKKVLETSHINNFKANIRGRIKLDLEKVSANEVWALGQHFGLYTPLLDWTRSPYVALYFSLFGECESGYRVIWALLESDIKTINKYFKNPNKKIQIVDPMTNHNQRLVSQRGLFLNIPSGVDIEKWLEPAKDFSWVTMYKISYSDDIRKDALAALDNMNINYLSLFPDITGSSLYANYQLEIEPFLEKERLNQWKQMDELDKKAKKLLRDLKKFQKDKQQSNK